MHYPQKQSDFYHHRLVLPLLEFYLNGITHYIFFCVFLSLQAIKSVHVLVVSSFLLLTNIPLCEYSIVCLAIFPLMNVLYVSSLWLVWIKL